MATDLEELLAAAMGAPPSLRKQAIGVLRGNENALEPGNAPKPPEPYMSLRAISRLTGISTTTLWRYEIPGHDLGGRPRYKLSEVESYLQSEEFKRRAAALRAERRRLKEGARPMQNPPNALPANPRSKTH